MSRLMKPSQHSQNLCKTEGDYHTLKRNLAIYIRHLKYIHSQNQAQEERLPSVL